MKTEIDPAAKYVIVVHGGAGVAPQGELEPDVHSAALQALARALQTGHGLLASGGTALDAVQSAVRSLEDDPVFNAGVGGALTSAGYVEHDAAIMEGAKRMAGAVSGSRRIKNPIDLARKVMQNSPHVLLQGAGAEAFAVTQGMSLCDGAVFITPRRQEALSRVKAGLSKHVPALVVNEQDCHGTVGAVALDQYGNIAAATSTGGITNKLPGRVGDSPLIGAGTYADNKTAALSGTGRGEYYMRMVFAHRIASLIELAHLSLEAATKRALAELEQIGGSGGVIGVTTSGDITLQFSGAGMFRGFMRSGDVAPEVAIY
jgi:L-asparaginase / beta-aspartyl-peptidase